MCVHKECVTCLTPYFHRTQPYTFFLRTWRSATLGRGHELRKTSATLGKTGGECEKLVM